MAITEQGLVIVKDLKLQRKIPKGGGCHWVRRKIRAVSSFVGALSKMLFRGP